MNGPFEFLNDRVIVLPTAQHRMGELRCARSTVDRRQSTAGAGERHLAQLQTVKQQMVKASRVGADEHDSMRPPDHSLPLFLDEKWPKIKERKQLSASALVVSPTMSSADQLDSAVQVSPDIEGFIRIAGPTIFPDQVAC